MDARSGERCLGLLLLVFGLVATALLVAPSLAKAQPPAQDNVLEDRYIVVYEPTVASVDRELEGQERAGSFKARFRYRHAIKGFAAKLSTVQVARLRADPEVAFITADRSVQASGAVPLAAGEPLPPTGVRRIEAATSTAARERSVTNVAVIDSGIDLSHPDLNAASGINCVTPGALPQDDNGHGTHVAGTVAARNNGSGVVGVVPDSGLYAVKVLDSENSGTTAQVICGLDWVTANAARLNIKVVNLSLGGGGANDNNCGATNGDALHRAVCRSTQTGVSVVTSAMNGARDIAGIVPAAYPEVLTVSAMSDSDGQAGGQGSTPSCRLGESDDAFATFSNYATTPADSAHTISAPGICITSTWPGGGLNTISGTSMASPHVAGALALCLGDGGTAGPCADKSPAQIIDLLRTEAGTHATVNPGFGFAGDPLRPSGPRYFGHLVRATTDTTAPETTITSGPSGTTNSSLASFSFSSAETGSSFECKLDTGAWEACSSPRELTGLSNGRHTFSVRARDAAGNTDPTEAIRTWTLEIPFPTVPRVTPTAGPTPRSTLPTLDQIAAALGADLAALARDLRRLGVSKLVRRRGFTARGLDAVLAGKFSITLTGTPRGSGVARKVLLAKGSRSVSGAGRYALKAKLTRRGRRLLRKDRRAKVTLTVTFRDSAARTATKRRSVRLRR